MTPRDYYEILDVDRDASQEEIKRAYRKVAMRYHPDRNPDDAEAESLFKEAAEAYEILRSPDQRSRYDQFGHAGVHRGAGAGGFHFDLGDALRAFMRDFGGFDDLFGARGRRGGARGPLRGSDVQIKMRVTLEEVSTGVERSIRAKLLQSCEECAARGTIDEEPTSCSACEGTGEIRQAQRSIFGQFVSVQPCPRCGGEGTVIVNPCDECGGEGRTRREQRIKVKIPAGVQTGNYLTLRGEGNAGPRGGPPGDLLVVIEETPHSVFERHGRDVVLAQGVSFPQAALGAEIEVPTLNGPQRLKVPAGTQSGTVLKLAGAGIPDVSGDGRGDQLVQVAVFVPTRLSEEDRLHLEALAESENLDPPPGEKGFWRRMKETFTT